MNRKDIKEGGVYAFHQGRLDEYTRVQPVLIVSTDLYEHGGFKKQKKLRPAEAGTPMGLGKGRDSASVGIVAVKLFDAASAGRVRELASVGKFSFFGDVRDGGKNAPSLGEYLMVVSSAHLHGDYAEVHARQEALEKARAETSQRWDSERKEAQQTRADLTGRLSDLGIEAGLQDERHPEFLTLSLDKIGKLIEMAEQSGGCE